MNRHRRCARWFWFCCAVLGSLNPDRARAAEPPPIQTTLPDPLHMQAGQGVTSAAQWPARRKELLELFQKYIYGYMPEPARIRIERTIEDAPILDGRALFSELVIHFVGVDKPAATVLRLGLFRPRDAKGQRRWPVFVALNKCGNQEVIASPHIPIHDDRYLDPACLKEGWSRPGGRATFWGLQTLIDRGYAFATLHESDVAPDRATADLEGVRALFRVTQGSAGERWATLAAWAFGLSRAVDALVSIGTIDATRIALFGHSRRGKAALLATAFDPRVALVVPHQSGTGGMALSRQNDQETVRAINDRFPHWFSARFKDFNDAEDRLPIDQHLLVALVAPRPLLATEGSLDPWANGSSGVRTLQAANPVYTLLGEKGVVGSGVLQSPTAITAQNSGRLLQYRLPTEHTMSADYWRVILDFADLQLPRASGSH